MARLKKIKEVPLIDLKIQHQRLKREINEAINKLLESAAFVLGKELEKFERNFANFCQVRYCLGVANGTQAIELSLRALGIGQGDEVILPTNTFIATAEAVALTGAKPVLVDVKEADLLIDSNKVKEALTRKTKAIIGVHLFGQPCDLDTLKAIAKKKNIFLLEDAAQAQGAVFRGRLVGGWGKVGCFSFYPSKNLGACGDGGAVVTNDKKIYLKIKRLRNHGDIKKSEHRIIGTNSRLNCFQAAILNIKLKHLREWNKRRSQIAKYYDKALSSLDYIRFLKQSLDRKSVFYLYVIRVPKRDKLKDYLASKNIGTGIHYPRPIHLTSAFSYLGYKKGDFPVAEKASQEILSLPIYPELKRKEIDYVVDNIKKFYKKLS